MNTFRHHRGLNVYNAGVTKKRNPKPKQVPKIKTEKAPYCHEQNMGRPIPDQISTAPKSPSLRVNIRHRGPIRSRTAQVSVMWTTHDVPGETKLHDLFKMHYLSGGAQPHDEVFLQQITRDLEHMAGTERYWWAEPSQKRVMDLNWIFEDNEIWLSCSLGEAP